MAIKVGDKLPQATFRRFGADGMVEIPSASVFDGKTVALFAVPGAYTPTCSDDHLPSYVKHADDLRAKGVDEIACVAVNDAFVLKAWGESNGVADKVRLLSDGNGEFTKAIGMELDASGFGLGTRSHRYAMLVKDGTVEALFVEENPTMVEVSGADKILAQLS
ncbi:MAG: peroxiredoxin [Geminicoccaceae bacterium]